jgi:hypothetical protein
MMIQFVLVLYLNDLVVDVELMFEINDTMLLDLLFLLNVLLIFVILIHVLEYQDQHYIKKMMLYFYFVYHLKEYFHFI